LATAPQAGTRYNREEDYRLAWAVADAKNMNKLDKDLPNRAARSLVKHWTTKLSEKPEFAWVMPRRIAKISRERQRQREVSDRLKPAGRGL